MRIYPIKVWVSSQIYMMYLLQFLVTFRGDHIMCYSKGFLIYEDKCIVNYMRLTH